MNWDQLRSCFQPHECEGCLFVIEGDPGAGKTTAIRQLASQFDLVVFPEIDHASQNHKLHTAKVLGSSDWYLEAEAARQIELKALLKSGYCVLQDRSLLSTMAFTYASATSQSKAARVAHLLDRAALLPSFIAPDSLMILTVDVATRACYAL